MTNNARQLNHLKVEMNKALDLAFQAGFNEAVQQADTEAMKVLRDVRHALHTPEAKDIKRHVREVMDTHPAYSPNE